MAPNPSNSSNLEQLALKGLTSHSTHNRSFRGRSLHKVYRRDFQTNSVKALKETSWSSRSGLNPTRTTPPYYNNTTLDNRLYAQHKGPNVTNLICLTCKNCSYKCAADCEHFVSHNSAQSCSDNIFRLNLQTIIITRMLSSEGEGNCK